MRRGFNCLEMLAEFPSGSTVGPALRLFVFTCLQDATSAERHFCISSDSLAHSLTVLCSLHELSKFTVFLCVEIHFYHFPFLPTFTLCSDVNSVSIVGGRLHIISSVQWESEWNSCIPVCLNLCQGLVVKTKSACFSVSRWNIDSISMSSNEPGRASVTPWGGEAGASGSAGVQ